MMKRLLLILSLALFIAPSGALASGILDFGLSGGGTIAWDGVGTDPLTGTGISIDSVTGIGTPLNNGVTLAISNGVLSFTTAAFSGFDSTDWYFTGGGNDGSIQITGTISSQINGILMNGKWQDAQVIWQGDGRGIATGDYLDTKNSNLAAYYGLGPNGWSGTLNPSFCLTSSCNGDRFPSPPSAFGGPVQAGDVINSSGSTVPEPASLALLGSGLVGMAGLIRRKLFS